MTAYERQRAWALAHPDRVRASKREHMRRRRADPDYRRAEYEREKFRRATKETP